MSNCLRQPTSTSTHFETLLKLVVEFPRNNQFLGIQVYRIQIMLLLQQSKTNEQSAPVLPSVGTACWA
jgi:hypothetical protein